MNIRGVTVKVSFMAAGRTTNEYGETDEASGPVQEIDDVIIVPRTADQTDPQAPTGITCDATMYIPKDANLQGPLRGAKITVSSEGMSYRVAGQPMPVMVDRSPTGYMPMAVQLRADPRG